MSSTNDTRRDFLRSSLGFIVVSSLAPAVALGRLTPAYRPTPEGLLSDFTLRVSDYPELAELGGSVLLDKEEQLGMNPDNTEWGDAGLRLESNPFPCKRGWYPITITRVAASGPDAFTAVSSFCPHEAEYRVNWDPINFRFVCCHEHSTFEPNGTWISPTDPRAADPNAPDVESVRRGLRKFDAHFDDVDTITLVGIPAPDTTGGIDNPEHSGRMLSIAQNVPNPARSHTSISFYLPSAATVELTLYRANGEVALVLAEGWHPQGGHTIQVQTSSLASGSYNYTLVTRHGSVSRRMTVQH